MDFFLDILLRYMLMPLCFLWPHKKFKANANLSDKFQK